MHIKTRFCTYFKCDGFLEFAFDWVNAIVKDIQFDNFFGLRLANSALVAGYSAFFILDVRKIDPIFFGFPILAIIICIQV